MVMRYKRTHGSSNRDKLIRRDFEVFIDVGSYRTTILCIPDGDDNKYIHRKSSDYLIPFGVEKELPSSYLKQRKGVRILDPTPQEIQGFGEENIVGSAKSEFIENYLSYPEGKNGAGDTAGFVSFIKALLEHTFKVMTSESERVISNQKETEVSKYWYEYQGIPKITGIRVTVPDLYIENLRKGYCSYVLLACEQLAKENPDWTVVLSDYLKLAGQNNKDKKQNKNIADRFVTISADESGAGELYFIDSMKLLSWINFSRSTLSKKTLYPMKKLFSQNENGIDENNEEKPFRIACCRIDIGGLTTDAGVSIIDFYSTTMAEGSKHNIVKYKLIKKESFSGKKAGEIFKEQYQQGSDSSSGNWWENKSFIKSNNCDFNKVISNVVKSQYISVVNSDDIDAVYFVISGRPTSAESVQSVLLEIILREFNKDKLFLFKEHCVFTSKYPQISDDPLGEWEVSFDEDLAKWVTSIGCENILDGPLYETDVQDFTYYIRLEDKYASEEMPNICIEGKEKTQLKDFIELAAQMNDGARSIDLSFSSKSHGEYIKFLNIKASSCRNIHSDNLDKCYPVLSIGEVSPQTPRSWIIPSISVETLEKDIHSLAWLVPPNWTGK